MDQYKKSVEKLYYSEQEWARLACGPLPTERNKQHGEVCAKGNPKIDGKVVKGYN